MANLTPKQRKLKLAYVMSTLYSDLQNLRRKKQRKVKENEVIKEMRMRVYKILKNLLWEKYEHRMCETETLVKLHHMLDICMDSPKRPLFCFEVYSKIFIASFTVKLLKKLKCIPLLGRIFYNMLINRMYMRFDLLLMMTITLSEILESKKFLKEEFEDWETIVKELNLEHINFEMEQNALLQGDPKLVKAIQTKKVGKTILNFGFQLLEKLLKSGEIDEQEKASLLHHLVRSEKKLKFTERYVRKFEDIAEKKKGKTHNMDGKYFFNYLFNLSPQLYVLK